MNPNDFFWLAGLLEGEGSFLKPSPGTSKAGAAITINMTDEDIIARAARIMEVSSYHLVPSKNPRHKDSWRVCLRGTRARDLMILLKPHMGTRRQGQIDIALAASADYRRRGDGPKLVLSQATEISKRFAAGESAVSLAAEFGVTKWTVYRIKEGRRAS